ncbi:MAG: hypothetical protein ACJASQ_001164 [Crocinitomicaceae bacterium]|jgi:hypothetical protein
MKKGILLIGILLFTMNAFAARWVLCNGSTASTWTDNGDGTYDFESVLGPCSEVAWVYIGITPPPPNDDGLEATESTYTAVNNLSGSSNTTLSQAEIQQTEAYLSSYLANNNVTPKWLDPNKLTSAMRDALYSNQVFGLYGLDFYSNNSMEIRSDMNSSASIEILDLYGNVKSNLTAGLTIGTQNVQLSQITAGLQGQHILKVTSSQNSITKLIFLY